MVKPLTAYWSPKAMELARRLPGVFWMINPTALEQSSIPEKTSAIIRGPFKGLASLEPRTRSR
jgi:hypothetical protein